MSALPKKQDETQATSRSPWIAFGLASVAQFMVVLDASITNVALPSIQRSLHFSNADLQWVVNIYVLMFGGFLLLGGRAGDLFGRRRLFIGGLVLFSLASLGGGFSQSSGFLIAMRGLQGLGGAIVSPVALAIVTSSFSEGPERNRALGIYGSLAGVGGAAGVLLGGILTSSLGWQWVLFVNVPVGLVAASLATTLIPFQRPEAKGEGVDVMGAVTVTAALVIGVYGTVKAPENGWGSVQTIGFLAVSVALIALFIAIETRSASPLVRLSIFRARSLTMANVAGGLSGAAMFAMFFFISLYLQNVLHYSALKSGFAYLPLALMIVVSAGAAAAMVTRFGYKPILITGMLLAGGGLILLTQIRVNGTYPVDVLPAILIVAAGLGLTFVPLNIAAVSGVPAEEIGLASGLINTSLQIGGALGLAILSTIFTSRFNDLIRSSRGNVSTSLVGGFHNAFFAAAIFLAVGAILTFVLLPHHRDASPTADIVAATA